jgi:hypothetical protein
MERAPATADAPYRILAYLFAGALLLSTSLNFYLLSGSVTPGLKVEAAAADELAAVETKLVHTQTLLAHCRATSQLPDTLAAQLRADIQQAGMSAE